MAGPGPWSVKGVDESTREIASVAARRADLPIGVWLDRAILKATETEIAPETAEATADMPAEASATETTTISAAEPGTAAAPGERAAPEPAPTPGAPACVDAARQGAEQLPLPAPSSEERVESAVISSVPPQRRGGFVRYGIGGVVALVLIGLVVAYVSEFGGDSASAPTARLAAPDREAPATAAATTKTTPPAPQANTPQSSVAQTSPAAGPEAASPAVDTAADSDIQLKGLATRAAGGDADAEDELALRYSAGRGVPKDDRLAAEWFEKAAVHGLAPAQYNLGVLFERGQGVARSPEKAFFWYQSAAQQHYARAEHNLATLYATGSGVAQNYGEAAKWFREAADAGIGESLYSLGLMYEPGLGRVDQAGVGSGQRPAQSCGGPGDGQPGQRPHPGVAGQRRHRISRRRPPPGQHPAGCHDQGRDAPGQQDGGDAHRDGGGVRPRPPGPPVQHIPGEFDAERFHGATRDPRREPGRGPDQATQRDQRPAGDEHRPPGGTPAEHRGGPWPQCPAHHEPPSWLRRIAWSVS